MAAPAKDIIALMAKLERAEEHIFKLQEFWRSFVDGGAYPIKSQDTPDAAYRMFYLDSAAPIPVDVPLLAGDAIQNLRSSLDHLAYRLVCVGTKSPGPFDRIYFPIAELPKEFKARIRAIKKCLTPDAEKALAEVKAYPGGPGEFIWQLHQLNNIDKHRLLLTIAVQNRLHSMSPSEIAKIRRQFNLSDIPESHDARLFLKSGTRRLDLKAGDVLDIFPMAEVHDNMHFPIEIAFGEPQIVKGKPVIETLHQAASLIRNMLMTFDRDGLLD